MSSTQLMDHLPLAEFDLREWFNLIILVLVFGGSALGGFLKWLVAKFSDDAKEQVEAAGPKASASPGGKPRPQVATPPPPVARPMPPHGTGRPVAKPLLPVRPPEPVRSRTRAAPLAKPVPSRPIGRSRPTTDPATRPKRRLQPDQPLPPELVGSAPQTGDVPHQGATIANIESRSGLIMRHLDPVEHLGLLSKGESLGRLTQAADAPQKRGISGHSGEPDPIRHPTRRGLRRAMILKELLGPPLALQPPDRFGSG